MNTTKQNGSQRFAGKVALVTGGSRGIGQAILLAFAREGAHAVGVDIGDLSATAEQVQITGARFTGLAADLGQFNPGQASELVREVVRQAGRVDVLVNCAGIIRRSPAVEYSEADWQATLQINLTVPFYLSQAVARWWLAGGRDGSPAEARLKILNIASMLSFQGGILVPAYTASKSGVAGLTRALACEWAAERVNVNAIAPGYIATEATSQIRSDPARNQAILARIPEGRWGTPDDVVGSCLFLASQAADYVNGAVLNIDGGWLAR